MKNIKIQISNDKTKKFNIKKKNLTKKQYNKLEYPYKNLQITKKELLELFEEFKQFKPKFINIKKIKRKIKKFNNRFTILNEVYNEYKKYNDITDYFSQYCRARCIFNLRENKNILTLFQENKKNIYNKLLKKNQEINYFNIEEYLYKKYSQCTNFNITIMFSLLKIFKPKYFLDFSAGWGDRLIGAIAYDCNYLGIDPSNCMKTKYKKIINTLCPKNKRKNYNIINKGYEDVEIEKNKYDLVFTSPPFFDLEIYENTKKQSHKKFNSVKKWKNNFLFPSIKKSYDALKTNGYLGLYITDYKNNYYIKDMKDFINKEIKNMKYLGDIHWVNYPNVKNIRTIFVWKKIK